MKTNNETINHTLNQEKTQHNKLTHTKSRQNKTKYTKLREPIQNKRQHNTTR